MDAKKEQSMSYLSSCLRAVLGSSWLLAPVVALCVTTSSAYAARDALYSAPEYNPQPTPAQQAAAQAARSNQNPAGQSYHEHGTPQEYLDYYDHYNRRPLFEAPQKTLEQLHKEQAAIPHRATASDTPKFYTPVLPENDGGDDLRIVTGHMNVSAPKRGFNYTANGKYENHGNLNLTMDKMAKDAQTEVEVAEENPLASPYYDPLTGKVNIPPEVLAQQRREKAQQSANKRMSEEEDRLRQYDKERANAIRTDPSYRPFGSFKRHDRIFAHLPVSEDIFYVRQPELANQFYWDIKKAEQDLRGQLSFVLLDQEGIVAIKDTTDYPMYGLTKFHLAYAVASLMSARGEGKSRRLIFDSTELKRNIRSPMVEILYAKKKSGKPSFKRFEDEDDGPTHRESRANRTAALASAVHQMQVGDVKEARKEARVNTTYKDPYAESRKKLQQETGFLDESSDQPGRMVSLSIGELMTYSLGHSDSNASSILLSYVGSLGALQIFDESKGLSRVQLKYTDMECYLDPQLTFSNTAPLYESAKLFGTYAQDKTIRPEVRKLIDDIMYFNSTGQEMIQRGVRNTLRGEPDYSELKIYSLEGFGRYMDGLGQLTVGADMALIEWRGNIYVMAISLKNVQGSPARSELIAKADIAAVSEALMKYAAVLNTEDQPEYLRVIERHAKHDTN